MVQPDLITRSTGGKDSMKLKMGTLLKSVSKLFVSHPNEKLQRKIDQNRKESSTVGKQTDDISDDTEDNLKRKSSAPEIDSIKRTCDDEYDSGVEPDRSPSDASACDVSSKVVSGSRMKVLGDVARDTRGYQRRRRGLKPDSPTETKQVNFEQHVVVHSAFIDEDGNRQSFCERGQLKMSSIRDRSLQNKCGNKRNISKPAAPTCWTTSVELLTEPDVRYRIAREARTGTRLLRFCIRLGPTFSGGATVLVKSNTAGNEIYLLAHRAASAKPMKAMTSGKSKSNALDVYQNSFPLPCVIDSNLLTAVVDTEGRVLVEAPVVAPADPLLERWIDRHPASGSDSGPSDCGKENRNLRRNSNH